MNIVRRLCWLCCVCTLLPLAAQAQWRWLDKDGRTVFSDTPPPPEIPDKNITQRGNLPALRPAPAAAGAPEVNGAAAPAAAKAPVDKELEEKVRRADEAEKAKKEAEERKVAQAKSENCTRARTAKATYDSGIRLARVNAQGEREFIDDNARAAETQRLQSIIESDCKP
ncbi:DUF4124 domain-containing protein [Variovorax sp.]|uniref:DUF4124 domain-containing protein n=1 Tax=Variovorax sp. TaxID=1871043 RepID=UPI002D408869|nr:DUF4124 domain-containing protein [Variovorax sp.]HYP86149.1 DUF4124 domain-containing protein [Variovorax sp.]